MPMSELIANLCVVQEVVSVDDFIRLRRISGLSPRPRAAVVKGLPRSLYGVFIRVDAPSIKQQTIAMGRVVGDGALNFEIVDVAVDPEYQGQGLGREIMQQIMNYLEQEAPSGAYITLMADVPALYDKFGFKLSRPESEGMYMIKQ
ncbi:GNAT family N-acetyltransferase [Shewanella eurypsychrophilus]|uniref:GNAT family N-acetyltransferase n=1 Tax=Shewanella eurypsychrophilus TaxID=2593656 RepID=A0ABX6VCU6_9GAMM|nr:MULTISPECIES: GNAT family N-acetyltransferase [Shewanella]QFU24980.1 GNAT family N-acetyltransferase [Shewanella sp. YLB-09]QPG60156.1 GNAT family N-acetyltransferase [Shewanella eurypsychrophilus]